MRKLKIIHIITRLIVGGAEHNTLITVDALRKFGFDATLISGVPIGPEGSLVEEAQSSGIKLYLLPSLVREIDFKKDLRAFFQLWWLLIKEKPDIVHTHCSKAGILGRWAALFAGVPIIYHTPHGHIFSNGRGLDFSSRFWKLLLYLERLTACFTDRILALTEIEKAELIWLPISRRKKQVVVVHSGVEIDKFQRITVDGKALRRELGLPQDIPVIGTVGRLAKIKGHRYLLDAIPKILTTFKNAHVLVVGDGPERKALEKQSVYLGIAGHVHFTGVRRDVASLLRCMDVFVLTSTHEAMGRVLVEAMAAGLPIVATCVGGVPAVVEDGKTGILIPSKDSASLADAIKRILSDKSLASALRRAGRKDAHRFSAAAMVGKIIDVYGKTGT